MTLDGSETFQFVKRLTAGRARAIVNMIRRGVFIKDDSLETYVSKVLSQLLTSNGLPSGEARVLILDSPEINAYCYGRGIYIVSIGLLGRISNEHELAFTIAHELAHDQIGHVRDRLVREAETSLQKKSKEQVTRILTGAIDVEDILEYKALVYGEMRHTRTNEMEADSMGIVLMQGAGYDTRAARSMLTALEGSLKPKFDIGADLVWPFNAKDYPLQEAWFRERLSIYSREYRDSYLYSLDSLRSHPDIALRKERIEYYRYDAKAARDHQPKAFVDAVTLIAEFETVQSAYEIGAIDRCLYYALQLLNRYPKNSFLVSRIGEILIRLYEARSNNDNTFQLFVPLFTAYYSEELKLVNNMLHNLSTKELGELTFHFLSDPDRFNEEDPNHYYLLWRISDLTYKNDVANEMRGKFREKFGGRIATHEVR